MALEAATEGNSLEMDLLLEKKMEFPWKQDREGESGAPMSPRAGKGVVSRPGSDELPGRRVINMCTGTKACAAYDPGTY